MMNFDKFFSYARERYRIKLRRDGVMEPHWLEALPKSGRWTNDHILQQYRFCNVFREDDTTTKWIREHITEDGYGATILQALFIARWFNRIGTLELLLPPPNCKTPYFEHNLFYQWDSDKARERLKDVKPLVTGAYMVKTPTGMNKLDGVLWCIDQFVNDLCGGDPEGRATELSERGGSLSLEEVCIWLQQSPFMGPFMSYEVVTDLRHTYLLYNAPDINTWANPGPGAARGFGRVDVGDKGKYNRHSKHDVECIMIGMRRLLEYSRSGSFWPSDWPIWEMREVEHTLCEFDKYERARLGEGRPKHKFKGFKHHSRIGTS